MSERLNVEVGKGSKVEQINRNRRSLRERLRDSVGNQLGSIPLVGSTISNVVGADKVKSRSVDSELLSQSPPQNFQKLPTSPRKQLNSDDTDSSNSKKSDNVERKLTVVKATDRDTLTSLAARYETTPSELIKLNRLCGRLIFPGQEIKVPERTTEEHEEVFIEEKANKFNKKFIKIGVRHVTDGNGVVSGTLLVTPNAVMFDPNVSDPLVIEQGAESYGVILPLEVIIHAGIYSDIAQMKVQRGIEYEIEIERPRVYRGVVRAQESPKEDPKIKRLSFPMTTELTTEGGSWSSAPPSASHDKKRDSKSFLDDDNEPQDNEWYLCLTTGRPNIIPRSMGLIVSYGLKNHIKPEYWFHIITREHVEVLYQFWTNFWPELYGESVDMELLTQKNYTPTTFSTMDIEPPQEKLEETLPDLKESWEMLKSLQTHSHTKLSSILNRSQTLLTSTSSTATNLTKSMLDSINDSISDFASFDINNDEVVSMSEELRQALYGFDNITVELVGVSEILEEDDLKELGRVLTPRAEGYPLTLIFTTTTHGFSLTTLFRRNQDIDDEIPILLVVKDTKDEAFGALISTSLKVSEGFYGTGQSFLFSLRPFCYYKWSGKNNYFVKSGLDGVAIGSGDGKFAIWLDSDLNCGRSDPSETFNNPSLSSDPDFVIKTIECWAFLSPRQPQISDE